jgi:hypothetical protein
MRQNTTGCGWWSQLNNHIMRTQFGAGIFAAEKCRFGWRAVFHVLRTVCGDPGPVVLNNIYLGLQYPSNNKSSGTIYRHERVVATGDNATPKKNALFDRKSNRARLPGA